MKKITLLLVLLTFSFGYSQDQLLGFESGESGGVVDSFGGAPAPIIEAGTGTNTTQVLKIVGNPAGEPWQGSNLTLTSLVDLTTTKTMTMDVFSADPITFLIKVTGGSGTPLIAAAPVTHPGGSTWQTLSFTFNTTILDGFNNPIANGVYTGFVIHTYWEVGRTAFFTPTVTPKPARTFYVDNIKGQLGTPPVVPAPTTAAPTPPTRPVDDVRSIFSNAYTNVATLGYTPGDNTYNTDWCGATTSLVQIQGNDTNKTTGLGCEGISFVAGRFDASTFTRLHIDIWTDTPTMDKVLTIKLSNWNNGTGETNAVVYAVTNANFLPSSNPGTWIPLDIPLSSFSFAGGDTVLGTTRNDIVQIILEGNLVNIYYDNLYLHKNTLSNTDFDVVNFKMYPNPANEMVNLSSDFVIDTITIYNTLGQTVSTQKNSTNTTSVDVSGLSKGVYILTAQIGDELVRKQFIKN